MRTKRNLKLTRNPSEEYLTKEITKTSTFRQLRNIMN